MSLRFVRHPLDPRFQSVVISDGAKDRCGLCGKRIRPGDAMPDPDPECADWLCKRCVAIVTHMPKDGGD